MKTTIVPAQVTTVEDRIAGNLTLSQLLFLALPVFGCSILYVALPPFMGVAPYKVVLMSVATLLCLLLAIRIKGRLLGAWLVVLARYHGRPRYYVFNKNVVTGRTNTPLASEAINEETETEALPCRTIGDALAPADLSRLEDRLGRPGVRLRLVPNRKGGLRAVITENQ